MEITPLNKELTQYNSEVLLVEKAFGIDTVYSTATPFLIRPVFIPESNQSQKQQNLNSREKIFTKDQRICEQKTTGHVSCTRRELVMSTSISQSKSSPRR